VTDTVPIYDPTKGTATPSPAALEPEATSGPTAPAVSAPGPLAPYPAPGEPLLTTDAEERVAVATQAQLMWRRFRKHRLAMLGAVAVILFYLVVLLADFLSYADPEASDAQRGLIAPQQVRLFLDGQFRPHVYAMVGERDPATFKRVYTEDPTQIIPLTFFSPGFDYKLLGFIPTDRHLIGVEGVNPEETLFLLGTDLEGRDMWSRVMFATRTSLTIGLVAVVVSLVLGVILGGISGFYGGVADTVIQRIIEILRSIPTIPLWMGLAAAMPKTWSIMQVYFTITIIISLIGWTELARVVRGRFLSLREEDFVTAADLVGASQSRIIFVHMVPLFLSHIIAATTLALPAMVISETALSFLGLGLRPPAISWGVLLQQAQNVQTVALSPWLLLPALPVILVILAFNFLGDGLRDAADPYS
jgi:peptide/nickel transport system permease protein